MGLVVVWSTKTGIDFSVAASTVTGLETVSTADGLDTWEDPKVLKKQSNEKILAEGIQVIYRF